MAVKDVLETFRSSRWFVLVWVIPVLLVLGVAAVFLTQWMRTQGWMQDFLTAYPGHTALPEGTPEGFPIWLNWAHFFNAFLIVLIVKSGWQVRTVKRPAAFWTRSENILFRTYGAKKKISIDQWLHLTLDGLWVINGIVFVVLLFVTGHWARIVPTTWEVFPNALSAGIQYVSLNWPLESGWVNYNSLQQLMYFTTVFVAAPLAIATGLRMSPAWPATWTKINNAYKIEYARAVHFPVMLYFVLFIIVHVTLVFATGALRNLNHMYASQDNDGWLGFWIFFASLIVMVAAWILARPMFLRPVAQLTGNVTRN